MTSMQPRMFIDSIQRRITHHARILKEVHPERLRSIVPMFGGAMQYVETLEWILEFVSEHQPTEDELIGWHRGTFDRVSCRDSITRRIDYLENVGFLELRNWQWALGPEGRTYFEDRSIETLLEIMCRRNVGFGASSIRCLQGR